MTKRISTYMDDNFLGGILEITVDEESKITEGSLTFPVCEECAEEHHEPVVFYASTKCKKTDTFSEKEGVEIVKLKIVKAYYSHIKRCARYNIDNLTELLSMYQRDYEYASRKLENVKIALMDKGFSYYGVEKKPKIEEIVEEKPKRAKKTTTKK